MLKRVAVPPSVPKPSDTRREFLASVDPATLCAVLEDQSPDIPYFRLYGELVAAFLKHDDEAANFAKILESIDGAPCVVEAAMRQAGFIVGFHYCRQLLLGEVQIPAAPERGAE